MAQIKITDNFLDPFDNAIINEWIFGEFSWFIRPTTDIRNLYWNEKEIHVMQHTFIEDGIQYSGFDDIIYIFKQKIPNFDDRIIRMNCNYVSPRWHWKHTPFHTDRTEPHEVFIYYLNGSTGDTIIGKNRVKPKRNRLVQFDGEIEHCHKLNIKDDRFVFNFNLKHL